MTKTVWRFGYGSNMSVSNLIKKKNLTPINHHTGYCQNWQLSFDLPGIPFVDPAFACVKAQSGAQVHGLAFEISEEEARGLDHQERGYDVVPVDFVAYDGATVPKVGLYVPKTPLTPNDALPSKRYLRLLQRGAREAGLAADYIQKLEAHPYYITPPDIREQTLTWIDAFERDPKRSTQQWDAATLAKHNGVHPDYPAHTASLGYVVKVHAGFASWRGHTITRRNLLHFRGQSVDREDIRYNEPGFSPLPDLSRCTAEEIEFLHQNLDYLLHSGGEIVARLDAFWHAQP